MKLNFFVVFSLCIACQTQCLGMESAEAIALNNEGVKAINDKDWPLAEGKFKAALKLEPNYKLAKWNLTIVHNMHAADLQTEHKYYEALRELHQTDDEWRDKSIADLICKMGKIPNHFADRVSIARTASETGDLQGAVIEYRAALELKNDPLTHKELGDVYTKLGEAEKATAEYKLFGDK